MSWKYNYNLIFGIGEACFCSIALRKCKLQVYSYPLDWVGGVNYLNRCKTLSSKFKNFLNLEDLEYAYKEVNINCTAYHNKKNGFIFNHDFLKELPLNESYPSVIKKYKRRINRLLKQIKKSKDILIVFMEAPFSTREKLTKKQIIDGFNIIKSGFSTENIKLLYIEHNDTNTDEEIITKDILRVKLNYKDKRNLKSDIDIKPEVLSEYMSKYKLVLPFTYKLKKRFLKLFINLIPIKSKRKEIRKIFHLQ